MKWYDFEIRLHRAVTSPETPAAKKSTREPVLTGPPRPRRLKLQQLLFLLLLIPSILPLLFSSIFLLRESKKILKDKEIELLARSAQVFVDHLSEDLASRRAQLSQAGSGLMLPPGPAKIEQRLRETWVDELLKPIVEEPSLILFFALDQNRRGLSWGSPPSEQVARDVAVAFDLALRTGQPAYQFTQLPDRSPAVALAMPTPGANEQVLVLQTLFRLNLGQRPASVDPADEENIEGDDFFMIDAEGRMLWSAGQQHEIELALLESDLVKNFVRTPFSVTQPYELKVGSKTLATLARVVEVRETGWGVIAHKAEGDAFRQVNDLVWQIALSSLLAIALALFFAIVATRWFSLPIARLAETSHEIAAGNFDRRVPTEGLVMAEIADMAGDFNRMSDYLERYIEQLRRAAEANRALFISSIRAFAAAIDAKDPYTRGHSERVAAYSRAIARYLGLPKDQEEKVWISAVLHDVGKIGVQDSVLQKHGVLTPDEFEQMKLHPVIGADIVEPINALRDMLPGIRWHHEAWNGTGYPDRLRGEQIPLMARVIGVADTFDAITTSRPYQAASSPEYAIETIKKLTGTKFDARIVTAFLMAWEAGQVRPGQSAQPIEAGDLETSVLVS